MSDLGIIDKQGLKEIKENTKENRRRFKKFKWSFLKDLIIKPFKELWLGICSLYYDFWIHKKLIFKISFIIFVVYTLFTGVQSLINGTKFSIWIIDCGKAILLYFIAKVIFMGIHYLFGYQLLILKQRELSDRFINEKMAKIAKISGATGAGKDSFMRYVGSAKRRYLIKKLKNRMKRISDAVYWCNFQVYIDLIENDVNQYQGDYSKSKYASLDPIELARVVAKDFLANESLIKLRYRNNYSAKEMNKDYVDYLKEPRFYKSKYVIDELIDNSHVINLIAEYVNDYFRLNVDKHFIMTNQPTIEDKKSKLMAKKFSLDYFKLIHDSKTSKLPDGSIKHQDEKVVFGLTENLIVLESEVDSFYNNLDKSVNYDLLESGVRDAFAYNRHLFGEDFSYYQVGQNAGRCASLMRELTHSFIYILSKKTIEGGRVRNIILKIINSPFSFLLSLSEIVFEYKKEKLRLKKKYLIQKYSLKYQAKHNENYLKKVKKIEVKKYPERKNFMRLAERINSWCSNQIQKNKNDGWLEMKISISTSSSAQGTNHLTLRQALKTDTNLSSAIVTVVFKRTESHGLYDTHYLQALKKDLVKKSEINYYNAEVWDSDMKLKKEDSIFINYKNMDKFFNNTKKERFKYSYKE